MKQLKVIQTERGGVVVKPNSANEIKANDFYCVNPEHYSDGRKYAEIQKAIRDNTCITSNVNRITHTIYPLILEGIQMIGEPKPAHISEEDIRKAMLHASYETLNNKGIISHRNIDEYIQSIHPIPTSAIFTDDGEFINFKY